jgi:hypothetical protein
MKTITTTLNGLASSLLLNVGLTHAAQKLDPVSHQNCEICAEAVAPALTAPCLFPAKR